MDQLRIVVGFKVTPDYEALRAGRLGAGGGGRRGAPETRYVRRVFNVFDEAALELALRLRDARAERGLETSLAAFSVAGREADPFLKTLQALGFERAARVDPGADLDFAPCRDGRAGRRLRGAARRRRPAARLPQRPRRQRRGPVPGRRGARPALPDAGHGAASPRTTAASA